MDIGLSFQDQALQGGADGADFFDLGEVEKKGVRKRVEGGLDDSDNTSDEEESEDSDEEFLDSDEEREARAGNLEAELDGLYDTYKLKLAERDTKWRVKETRRKDKLRSEAWNGVKTNQDSDEDMEDGDESPTAAEAGDEGGWDRLQATKAKIGESDTEYSSDEDEDEPPSKKLKVSGGRATPVTQKEKPLITKLEDVKSRPTTSKAAQVWFGQDVFKGLGDTDILSDEDEEMESSVEGDNVEELSKEQQDGEDDSDFEVVPQDVDDDDMWDVEDVDIDEQKQRRIDGKYSF